MKVSKITIDALKELLAYDRETGVVVWRVATSNRVRVGQIAGVTAANGRRYISVMGEIHMAHRLIWFYENGTWPEGNLVPEDGDYLNLRIKNLREESPAETSRRGSQRRVGASGVKGVSWDASRGKWLATITRGYKQSALGRYDTKEEAAAAYAAAVSSPAEVSRSETIARAATVALRNRHRSLWERVLKASGGVTGWESFDHFIADVGGAPRVKHVMAAADPAQMIGPSNFMWVSRSEFDHTTREGRIAYNQAHRAANPNLYRDKELRKNFGIGLTEYLTMLNAQNGVCAICGETERATLHGKPKALAVDHDHESGAIRLLLCSNCNPMIGYALDDPDRLRKAADYLDRHAGRAPTARPSDGRGLDYGLEFPANFHVHAVRDCGAAVRSH